MILKNSDITSLEEILRAIPVYYFEFEDYMALQRFVADEMDLLNAAAMNIVNDAFIFKCSDETLREIERFLKIYDIAKRIADRTVYVNSVLTSIGKLSVSKLQSWIKATLNEEPKIDFVTDDEGNRILSFDFEDHSDTIHDVITLIAGRLPAGMLVIYISKFNMEETVMHYGSWMLSETGYEDIKAAQPDTKNSLDTSQYIGAAMVDAGYEDINY